MELFFAKLGVGSYYLRYYACWIAALAVVLAVAWIGRRRIPRLVRIGLAIVVCTMALRLVLFENPWMLHFYVHSLTVDNLGMRQGGVLNVEAWEYRRDIDQAKLANLVVGSSQVGAIFYQWTAPPPAPLAVYSLAGMKPLDFVLHEEAIAAHNPARIILYTSAFDMTGSPELYSLPLAPAHPLQIPRILGLLHQAGLTADDLADTEHAYLFSQFLPEYRYSFISRAYLRQWFGGAPRPDPAASKLPMLSDYYDPHWLDYNFLFLREFLTFCHDRGIDVLILEGQTNPKDRTASIDDLNGIVRARIHDLMREFPAVRYVPAADVYEFTAEDYHDSVHVLPEAARRYTARFAKYLKP